MQTTQDTQTDCRLRLACCMASLVHRCIESNGPRTAWNAGHADNQTYCVDEIGGRSVGFVLCCTAISVCTAASLHVDDNVTTDAATTCVNNVGA
jgi:hypothetical protein